MRARVSLPCTSAAVGRTSHSKNVGPSPTRSHPSLFTSSSAPQRRPAPSSAHWLAASRFSWESAAVIIIIVIAVSNDSGSNATATSSSERNQPVAV